MTYLSQQQLESLKFKQLGREVKISDKASIYNPELISLGDHSRIDDFCVVSGNISIGQYVHIAPFCLLAGGEKGLDIGDFAGISYGCKVFTQSDDYSGMSLASPLIPAQYKLGQRKSVVTIERHVIIGAGSIVFPGVTIAVGCAIGAMTLVMSNTDPWGIYIGIPAKRIKERHKNMLILEKEFLEEHADS